MVVLDTISWGLLSLGDLARELLDGEAVSAKPDGAEVQLLFQIVQYGRHQVLLKVLDAAHGRD